LSSQRNQSYNDYDPTYPKFEAESTSRPLQNLTNPHTNVGHNQVILENPLGTPANNFGGIYGNVFNTPAGNQTIGLNTQLAVGATPYQTANLALHAPTTHPFTPNTMAIKIPR